MNMALVKVGPFDGYPAIIFEPEHVCGVSIEDIEYVTAYSEEAKEHVYNGIAKFRLNLTCRRLDPDQREQLFDIRHHCKTHETAMKYVEAIWTEIRKQKRPEDDSSASPSLEL